MKSIKVNGLYVLQGSSVPLLSALQIKIDIDKTKLWHLRLGYMSVKVM